MPKPLAAHRSSAHRLACWLNHCRRFPILLKCEFLGLSLYKALLKSSASISPTQAGGLASLIRHRFKTDRFLQSPSQIANGLDAGHEGLDLLRASAQGKPESVARLSSLLESTLQTSEKNTAYRITLRSSQASTSPRLTEKTNHICVSVDKALQSHRPSSRPILERPLPLSEIRSGKRRVPKFMAMQGIPLLYYSKPQPASLGRILRQKTAWQMKKWDQRSRAVGELTPLAESEDDWDAFVALQMKQEGLTNEESLLKADVAGLNSDAVSWQSASRAADASISQKLRTYEQKNLETSHRMIEILKLERLMAAQEKAELKSKKYEQRTMRGVDEFLAAVPGRI